MTKSKWKWFGVAGHFCAASWCRFHLCTKVGRYLVSSVGEYVHPRHFGDSEETEAAWLKENWPGEEIGLNRKYETMVFKAGKPCKVKDCNCGMPEIGGSEIDMLPANDRGTAQVNHIKLCNKYSKL